MLRATQIPPADSMTAPLYTAPDALAHHLNVSLVRETDLGRRLNIVLAEIAGRVAFSTSLSIEDQAVLNGLAAADQGKRVAVFMLDTGGTFPRRWIWSPGAKATSAAASR